MLSSLTCLVLSAVLAWLMLLAASALRCRAWEQDGMRLALGNRDDLPAPTPLAGRADRAARNMMENLAIFTALVAAVHFAGKANAQVQLGANLFFWARLVFWPVYLAGIVYLRTAVWFVSIAGMIMVAWQMW